LLILRAEFKSVLICVVRNAASNAAHQAARQVMAPGATVADTNAEFGRRLSVFDVNQFTGTADPSPITLATDRVTDFVSIPRISVAGSCPDLQKRVSFVLAQRCMQNAAEPIDACDVAGFSERG
jgi:hypothetical protein